MEQVKIRYNNKEVLAFKLAVFTLESEEEVTVKKLFFKTAKKEIVQRKCVLVLTNEKDHELLIVPFKDLILDEAFKEAFNVKEFISTYDFNDFHDEFKICDFEGYQFIYDEKTFIASVMDCDNQKPLEIIRKNLK